MFRFIDRLIYGDERIEKANAKLDEEAVKLDEADHELDALMAKLKEARAATEKRVKDTESQGQELRRTIGDTMRVVKSDGETPSSSPTLAYRRKLSSGV
jgi:DNA repair exonuclease SbcCD ATPase subunit